MSDANDRPLTITQFEIFMFISIAVSLITILSGDVSLVDALNAKAAYSGNNLAYSGYISGIMVGVMVFQLISVLIVAGITLVISRLRQNWARWVLLIFFIIGTPLVMRGMIHGDTYKLIVGVAQTILQLMGLILIFQRDSSDWLKSK